MLVFIGGQGNKGSRSYRNTWRSVLVLVIFAREKPLRLVLYCTWLVLSCIVRNILVPYALAFVFYRSSLTLESNIGFLMSSILGIIHNTSGCLTPCILFCTNKSFGDGIRKTLSDLRSFLQHNLTLKTTTESSGSSPVEIEWHWPLWAVMYLASYMT